jgi:hypothetical protein
VSFARDNRRKFEPGRGRFVLPRFPPAAILRIVVLAALGILGAVYALVSHYTTAMPPLRVPVAPASAPTYDADAGEMPIPEIDRESTP